MFTQTRDIKQKIMKFRNKRTFLPPPISFLLRAEATFPRVPQAVAGTGLPAGLQGAAPAAEPRGCRSGAGRRESGPAAAGKGSRRARHLPRQGAWPAPSRALPSAGLVPVPVRLRCRCGCGAAVPYLGATYFGNRR